MDNNRHYKRIFSFLYKTLMGLFIKYFRIETETIELPDGPCLVLANHVTDIDPAFVSHALGGKQTYFVCADVIMRMPVARWFLQAIFNPIVHTKGKVGLSTVATIMKKLKEGQSVSMFPEGNRSFSGRTSPLTNVIGKLAKKSGANLVLIRIEGGYFTQPRWGTTFRRGKIVLKNGGVYTKDQLASMSVAEITALIENGIYTDAYQEQEIEKTAYSGKHMCLGLEAAIYRCPKCGRIGTLKSDDNSIFCECGFNQTMNQYGFLVDETGAEHKITDYVMEQRNVLETLVGDNREDLLFEDNVKFVRVSESYKLSDEEPVHIKAYADHVEVTVEKTGSFVDGRWMLREEQMVLNINHDNLDAFSIFSRNKITIYLKDDATAYEVRGGISFNALKYRDLFEITSK